MILVLLGTQNNSFHRLLEKVQQCIDTNVIQEEVIVQAGSTTFESKDMKIFKLLPSEELKKLIIEARVIITHGGVGSIINSLQLGKKVIAVPRLSRCKEHVNDHQMQLVETFDQEGFIKGVFEIEKLPEVLTEIENFTPKTFISNTNHMIELIEDFIQNKENK